MTDRLMILALSVVSACTPGASDDADELDGGPADCAGWSAPADLELAVSGAVVEIHGQDGEFSALSDVGQLTHYQFSPPSTSEQIGAVGEVMGLRSFVAVGAEVRVAGGDGGQLWRHEADQWLTVESGTSEDIHTLLAASDGAWALAVTASQVLLSSDQGNGWAALADPAQPWSGLRRGFWVGAEVWIVGDGGLAWSSSSPADAWQSVELPSSEDLTSRRRWSPTTRAGLRRVRA